MKFDHLIKSNRGSGLSQFGFIPFIVLEQLAAVVDELVKGPGLLCLLYTSPSPRDA